MLLSDEASDRDHLRDVVTRVDRRMMDELDIPSLGMFPHFSFRSQSEQDKVNEPAWA